MSQTDWNRVKEEKPPKDVPLLVCWVCSAGYPSFDVMLYQNEQWHWLNDDGEEKPLEHGIVTHWYKPSWPAGIVEVQRENS